MSMHIDGSTFPNWNGGTEQKRVFSHLLLLAHEIDPD
jgi:hypothetical protein